MSGLRRYLRRMFSRKTRRAVSAMWWGHAEIADPGDREVGADE